MTTLRASGTIVSEQWPDLVMLDVLLLGGVSHLLSGRLRGMIPNHPYSNVYRNFGVRRYVWLDLDQGPMVQLQVPLPGTTMLTDARCQLCDRQMQLMMTDDSGLWNSSYCCRY